MKREEEKKNFPFKPNRQLRLDICTLDDIINATCRTRNRGTTLSCNSRLNWNALKKRYKILDDVRYSMLIRS